MSRQGWVGRGRGLLALLALVGLVACGGGKGGDSAATGKSAGDIPGPQETALLLQKAAAINTAGLAAAAADVASGGPISAAAQTKATAQRVPVHRFFNTKTTAHFYTISETEKATVQATLPVYSYEGVAFYVSAVADAGLSPVYRFFNVQTGVHFYSINAEEKALIESNLPQFQYEGVAYYASKVAGGGTIPLYRFYQNLKGFHFYTANQAESDEIRATLPQYTFENVGYYVYSAALQTYPLSVNLGGLAVGQAVVLQNNGGDDLSLGADGTYEFASHLLDGTAYNVTVKTQPSGQVCSVTNGSGTATASVSSAQVVCVTSQYTIGGTVSGLGAGKTLVLQNNGAGDLSREADGAFGFTASVAHGAAYAVTVKTQPVGQSCSVVAGAGTATANVSSVVITCATNTYFVGGSISGLGSGKSLELQNNGAGDLSLAANGVFAFAMQVDHGATYAVSVKTQPVGQVCSVTNGSGVVTAAVSTVQVVCVTNQYTIGGTVSGLGTGKTLVLQNNGTGDLSRTANGAFVFTGSVVHGAAYAVTVKTQPVGQSCSVAAGTGTTTANVATVAITCATNIYSVGGSISGLGSGKSLVLQNNASNDLARSQNGNFVFTTLIPYGSPYAVSIKTQPVDQTCAVANGLGAVGGQVSSVAISCVDHVSVGGTVSGLNVGIPVVLTLNGGGDTSLSANGSFTMASKTPLGAVYVVGVKTQPRGQTCTVTNGTGTANGAINSVVMLCANNPLTDLVISEMGGCPFTNSACWLEVFNPTANTLNLSNYLLRTGQAWATPSVFVLPSVSIAPGQYRILAGNLNAEAPITPLNPVVMVGSASAVPMWGQYSGTGLVELVGVASSATVDAIRFGSVASAPQPLTAGHWSGLPVVTAFTGGATDQSRSLVRPLATVGNRDTDSAQDWVAVDYATPGGPNDVAPGAVDADNDGTPDANELAGSTYNGLDLYSMGARAGQRDIFIEVDHMNSTKAGVIPIQASMQMVKNAFALRGIAVHIDVGNQFSAGVDPTRFNLGQGNATVPYESCLGFSTTGCASNTSANYRTVYDWKWQHFDPRRRAVFHYALFGDADAANANAWGRGELFGNDFVVTMGNVITGSDWLTNEQANTFMHELGHNLGLHHGGDVETNYKPNYLSVMNYLKHGVSPGNSIWPFMEWKWSFGGSTGNVTCYPGNTHPLCTADPAPFVIDYSDGSSLPLNESALYESANVGRGALPGVYADWDENGALTPTAVARDLNGDGVMGVLTDHNDWAALTLPFVRTFSGGLFQKSARMNAARKAAKVPTTGATVPNPLTDDRGPTVIVCRPEPYVGASGASNKRGRLGKSPRLLQPVARQR